MMLVSDAENVKGPNYPETEVFHRMVSTLKSSLADFLSRAELCCEELATMVYICHFCERVGIKDLYVFLLLYLSRFFTNFNILNRNDISTVSHVHT